MRPADPSPPSSAHPSGTPAGAAPGQQTGAPAENGRHQGEDADLLAAWGAIRGDLSRIAHETRELGSLRLERVKLATQEGAHTLLLGGFAGLAAITATVAATALLVAGLAGALGALFGAAWVGMLVAGLLVLGGAALALVVMRARMRASFRERLERKYGPVPRSSRAEQPPGSQAS